MTYPLIQNIGPFAMLAIATKAIILAQESNIVLKSRNLHSFAKNFAKSFCVTQVNLCPSVFRLLSSSASVYFLISHIVVIIFRIWFNFSQRIMIKDKKYLSRKIFNPIFLLNYDKIPHIVQKNSEIVDEIRESSGRNKEKLCHRWK